MGGLGGVGGGGGREERGGGKGGNVGKGHPQNHEPPLWSDRESCENQSPSETRSRTMLPATSRAAADLGEQLEREPKKDRKKGSGARWLREAALDSLCAVIITLKSNPTAIKRGQQVFAIPPHGRRKKKKSITARRASRPNKTK